MALFRPQLSPEWAFTTNLIFYLVVFFLPILLFGTFTIKVPTFSFLGYTLKKVHISLIAATAMFVIFFASHGFKLSIVPGDKHIVLTLLGAVLAGFFEETAFRGFYLKVLTSKIGFPVANIITSLLFAALHFNQIIELGAFQAVMLFIFSLFTGYLAHHTKSLTNAVIVHSAYNILQVIF